MSTFSAFRSAAVEVLHLGARRSFSPALGRAGSSTSKSRVTASTYTPHRHLHVSPSPRATWVKNSQPNKAELEAREKERKAKELKRKEIGLKDKDITYHKVQVSSHEGLSSFVPLRSVLEEVKYLNSQSDSQNKSIKKRYYVQLVANDPNPIVKVIDSKAEFQKKKEAKEQAKGTAAQKVRKEVQLTWASSGADVETKLEKMKEDLERGYKVDLVIMPKKGVRPPLRDAMEERAQELTSHFAEIAKEWKAPDFTRSTAVLYFQGLVAASVPEPEVEEKQSKIPKSQLLKEERRQKLQERLRKKQELEARSRNHFVETDIHSV